MNQKFFFKNKEIKINKNRFLPLKSLFSKKILEEIKILTDKNKGQNLIEVYQIL